VIALVVPVCARAETQAAKGKVTVYISNPDEDKKIKDTPVMVSLLLRNKVVAQSEIRMDSLNIFDDLPVGTYEVRAEGAGLASIFKRGVVVTAKGDTAVRFPMKAGKGATVITYSTANPGKDELEALLKRLEKVIGQLEKSKRSPGK
jgi:hypothetical protein